jgi:hypothetical protein
MRPKSITIAGRCMFRHPWVFALCALMGVALLYVNVVGETETWVARDSLLRGDFTASCQVRGWPIVYSDPHSDSTGIGARPSGTTGSYLAVVDTVLCGLMLVSTGIVAHSFAHRWSNGKQWTLGEMFLLTTAMALSLSVVAVDWRVPYGSVYRGSFHHLRGLPFCVKIPLMIGVFCTGYAVCLAASGRLLTDFLRTKGPAVNADQPQSSPSADQPAADE